MKKEEIIKLAQEAGFPTTKHLSGRHDIAGQSLGRFERFAALVAEREREECAKVCEETTAAWTQHLYNSGCVDCATAIRARSDT